MPYGWSHGLLQLKDFVFEKDSLTKINNNEFKDKRFCYFWENQFQEIKISKIRDSQILNLSILFFVFQRWKIESLENCNFDIWKSYNWLVL